jgi:AcrR family transcriptional regulator
MSTRLTGAERRDQILACARYVFAQDGYDGARTADIAERAGVSERLMYKHFAGKRELFVAVTEDTAARVAAGYRAVAREATDIESAMAELYDGRLGPGRFHGRTHGVFFARVHGPFGDEELDGAISAAYRTLASAATYFFKQMLARGLVRADLDAEVAAWRLSGILHLHDPLWSAHSGRRAATLERRIVDTFVQDLKPRSPSPR